jgi:hypothetical protein
MRWLPFLALLILLPASREARAAPPLRDPISLNIGFVCQWQQRCIAVQKSAMKRALKYVRKEQPPAWRIQTCNRNAARSRFRVDWVGFDNCVRNAAVRPLPPPIVISKKRARRITQSPPPASKRLTQSEPTLDYSRGERG